MLVVKSNETLVDINLLFLIKRIKDNNIICKPIQASNQELSEMIAKFATLIKIMKNTVFVDYLK